LRDQDVLHVAEEDLGVGLRQLHAYVRVVSHHSAGLLDDIRVSRLHRSLEDIHNLGVERLDRDPFNMSDDRNDAQSSQGDSTHLVHHLQGQVKDLLDELEGDRLRGEGEDVVDADLDEGGDEVGDLLFLFNVHLGVADDILGLYQHLGQVVLDGGGAVGIGVLQDV
jgi:hypothetical protein